MTSENLHFETVLKASCFAVFVTSFSLLTASAAQAQEKQPPERYQGVFWEPQSGDSDDDWNITFAAGLLYAPSFQGSEDYQLMAIPDIKVEYKDHFFASLFEGVGYNLVNSNGWRIGPIAKLDFGRQEDQDNPFRLSGKTTDALLGLGDVDLTVELGGFVEYSSGPFSYSLEVRQAIGGHEGLAGEVGINYTGTTEVSGRSVFYAFGPSAIFADANYNNAYFGINSLQSSRSGYAEYDAGSGLVSYGLVGFAAMSLSDAVSLSVFGRYERLGAEAADSPLIEERGDRNQFMTGLRISYKFGF